MKVLSLVIILVALSGCETMKSLTPASVANLETVRADLQETRNTVAEIAASALPSTPTAQKAAYQAQNFSPTVEGNLYNDWIGLGIGLLSTVLVGGGAAVRIKGLKNLVAEVAEMPSEDGVKTALKKLK